MTMKSSTTRAALAAALLAIAAGTMTLTAPFANADVSSDCTKNGGTYAVGSQPQGIVETCTTTDKSGNKTTCSWVNDKSKGCVPTPLQQPPSGQFPGIAQIPPDLRNAPALTTEPRRPLNTDLRNAPALTTELQ
jgi:hypothetical protein